MHVFPATFDRHGTRQDNQVIAFEVDDSNRELIRDIATMRKNTPLVVVVYEVQDGEDPLQENFTNNKAMSNNFMGRIHAILKEYEAETGLDHKEIKKILKLKMKGRGVNKTSLKEMTESELATAVFILNTNMHPSKFDYSEYKK